MYDLDDLAVFSSVMRHGGLGASARALALPKSTVSRRLRKLERETGQPLLRRHGNRMVPTEAGAVFDRYCREMLRLAEQSQETLDELRQEVSGELTLHVHEAFARGWFAFQVETFLAQHPGVRVVLRTGAEPPLPSQNEGICVWLGPVSADSGLRQESLGQLGRGVYAHPDYLARHGVPEHPRELARHGWVDLLGDSFHGVVLRHVEAGVFPLDLPPSRMEVDRLVLHGDAIARGHGLGLLPHWIAEVRTRYHPGTLTRCLPEWEAPTLPVSLLFPHGYLPRRARAFIVHIRAAVPHAWKNASGRRSGPERHPAAADAFRPARDTCE